MVGLRATRSSNNPDKSPQKPLDSKKRKRVSDSADEPAQKLQRTDAAPYAATIPIDPNHAAQILHVLQMIDQQRLLDRVYPLEQSASSAPSYSLRTLLQNSQDHTLATLRTAVNNLVPISIHPRAQTAAPAAQQQRFCDIALDLLAQASFHPVSLNVESLLPAEATDEGPRFVATTNKRYALMQHLPGGDFWTSANIPFSSEPETRPADLKDLPTGHADLVAIFPTPSAPPFDPTSVPKLGEYARAPIPSHDVRPRNAGVLPVNRRVTCGSFLDYGVDASFAPTWVNDGREVGMRQIAEVYAQREQRYLERLAARQRALEATREMQEAAAPKSQPEPVDAEVEMVTAPPPDANVDVDALQDILAPEEIDSLKAVLGSLELENAVQELLTRNRRALQRLGQLQTERLRAPGGRTSAVREGDEEWDVANGILDSLTLLASIRPRSSAHPAAPLVPPPAVLHALQQTLPRAPEPGWHGTLPSRIPALRDNSTVKVRPGVPAVAPPPVPPPASIQPVMPTPVGGAYYPQQQQRVLPAQPGTGGQYRYSTSRAPGQATPQQQQYAAQGQVAYPGHAQLSQQPGNYYGNAVPYGGGYAAGGAWFGASGSGSGAYTPQQQQGTATPGGYATSMPVQVQPQPQTPTPGYGAFMGAAGGSGSGVSTPVGMNLGGGGAAGGKAVANTVLGKLGGLGGGAALSGWSAGAGTQTPPVLPPHLRAAVAAATVTGGGGSGSGYHTPS
ncbi:hypothetical protein C8F04DRAFT_1312004 [Mycena alexandri]|uniref:Uncharacterized protein n=1 Tax=Mycena alexandri TaxID=1745969 RepID=A0AAD6WR22_9AGAR|nr:hypothetical protein C8F04DRAFT_1312004 [Mycena alexandri]